MVILISPVQAQISIPPDLQLNSIVQIQNWQHGIVSGCVRLDGRCIFKVSDQKSDLSKRIADIEQRLRNISHVYFQEDYDTAQLNIRQQTVGNLRDIYISVAGKEVRLLTVTNWDADIEGVNIETRTNQIIQQLQEGLERARQQRHPEFLLNQGLTSIGIIIVIILSHFLISRGERFLINSKHNLSSSKSSENQPIPTQIRRKQQFNIAEVQHRILQVTKVAIWLGGILFILGLFPYTRIIQLWFFSSLGIPLQVGIIAWIIYVLIRLNYALISRLNAVMARNYLANNEFHHRLQVRLTTISGVARGIVTISWIVVGILIALSVTGVNITPVLAGAGIIGLGLSLASQSLIKDAIHGFFIILEDQYALGDWIVIGDVDGMVEEINLRITRLRNSEGELITIPNSEIKIVRNLSNTWSRADLSIPIAYQTDIDIALDLITQVADNMSQEPTWQDIILENPQVLGVDRFGTQGIIIRIWFKTKPLQQWSVSREFRRRIKIAFDQAGIPIPIPQQQVWFREFDN